jgi:hypothetical protein
MATSMLRAGMATPFLYRPIGRIKPPSDNPSIRTSARISSLVEGPRTEARLLTRCHRITGGYFPDVDLLRGCHRPPASGSDEKLRTNASVGAGTRALTDTTGAHRFWRYERLLTMTLRARKEHRSEAKFKRYRVHSPRLQRRNFGACPMRLSPCCYFCVIIWKCGCVWHRAVTRAVKPRPRG